MLVLTLLAINALGAVPRKPTQQGQQPAGQPVNHGVEQSTDEQMTEQSSGLRKRRRVRPRKRRSHHNLANQSNRKDDTFEHTQASQEGFLSALGFAPPSRTKPLRRLTDSEAMSIINAQCGEPAQQMERLDGEIDWAADIDRLSRPGHHGVTLAHYAAEGLGFKSERGLDVLRELKRRGVSLDEPDSSGITPLLKTVSWWQGAPGHCSEDGVPISQEAIVRFLVEEAGADYTHVSNPYIDLQTGGPSKDGPHSVLWWFNNKGRGEEVPRCIEFIQSDMRLKGEQQACVEQFIRQGCGLGHVHTDPTTPMTRRSDVDAITQHVEGLLNSRISRKGMTIKRRSQTPVIQ